MSRNYRLDERRSRAESMRMNTDQLRAEAKAQGEHAVAMTELAQSWKREAETAQIERDRLQAEVEQERRMRQTMETRHGKVVAENAALRAEVTEFQAELRNAQAKLCDAVAEAEARKALAHTDAYLQLRASKSL